MEAPETMLQPYSPQAETSSAAQRRSLFPHAEGFDIHGGHFAAGDIHYHAAPNLAVSNPRPLTLSTPANHPSTETAMMSPWLDLNTDYSENEIYCRQLLRRKRGFPLYDPGPQRNLPSEYRQNGVAIGDVGRVTPEGVFDFFFNIYLPAHHPINANDVPNEFSPLEPYESKDIVELDFDPGNYVASRSIEVRDSAAGSIDFPGGDFRFNCKGPHGAVLALPYGSHLWKLENLELVRQYAKLNAESWYKYINCNRGRCLTNGSLYLITGCEKSYSGGMATFQNISTGNDFQLLFRPSTSTNKYQFDRNTPALTKHFPTSMSSADPPLNHTTFIHGFTISIGEGIWGRLFGNVGMGQIADTELQKGGGSNFAPFSGSQGSMFSWAVGFFGGGGSGGNGPTECAEQSGEEVVLSNLSPTTETFHPAQLIHKFLFEKAPDAKIVITHDDDWNEILHDDVAQPTVRDTREFLEHLCERFVLDQTTDGTVSLVSKSQLSDMSLADAGVTPPGIASPQSLAGSSSPPHDKLSQKEIRPGRKKALLIGIRSARTAGYPELKTAHDDVYKMRDLLIDHYGYHPPEISILVDDGISGHVQPTRQNILLAIAELVQDVQDGDHLFFHYSGHSTEVDNRRSDSEDDGKDECLVPLDGEDMLIVDNELRTALVSPLPAGAELVVVLDTSHSASLLDLKHYRCNRVVVPWTWRGRRNGEDDGDRVAVRRNARMPTLSRVRPRTLSDGRTPAFPDSRTTAADVHTQTFSDVLARRHAPIQPISFRKHNLPTAGAFLRTDSSTISVPPQGGNLGKGDVDPAKVTTPLRTLAGTTLVPPPEAERETSGGFWLLPDEGQRCESPVELFACNGWCHDVERHGMVEDNDHQDHVEANVISLASCKDSQETWVEGGISMTATLVDILREDPQTKLKDVLLKISHAMHSMAVVQDRKSKENKRQRNKLARDIAQLERGNKSTASLLPSGHLPALARVPTFPSEPVKPSLAKRVADQITLLKQKLREMRKPRRTYDDDAVQFQDPQLASVRPLDMNRPWRM